ncbi:Polo kinase 1, partial [Fasciola gigantica]
PICLFIRSHEQLLNLPKLHYLIPWKSPPFSISPQTNHEESSFYHSTQTLSGPITSPVSSSRLDPLERVDELPGRPEKRRGKRNRPRLQTGLWSFFRSPRFRMRFSSMDVLPTSPPRPTSSAPPPAISRTQTELFEPRVQPPSVSWIEVNESDLSCKEPPPDPLCRFEAGIEDTELSHRTCSKSCTTLIGTNERTKIKFETDSLKIPIPSSQVQMNPPTDFSIHVKRLLGQGANGFCHEVSVNPLSRADSKGSKLARKDLPPKQCTLKVIPPNVYLRKREAINREICIQKRISHPNLLKLYMAYHDSRLQAVCLLLEFCALGSLLDIVSSGQANVINSVQPFQPSSCSTPLDSTQPFPFVASCREIRNPETGGLSEALASHIFRGLMCALDHLHERLLIVHRDIKPSNIMLTDGWQAKLSDFGLACTVNQCLYDKSICGTPNYLAPEVFLREGHSKAADCWAAGATLYYMLCARAPFQPVEQANESGTGFLCLDGTNQFPSTPVSPSSPSSPQPVGSQVRSICRCLLLGRYEFPSSVSQSARLVIQRLLQRDPKARPTAAELMCMEFCLQQYDISEPCIRSDQNKFTSRTKLFPLLQPRVIGERLRRTRSLAGLHHRSRGNESVSVSTADRQSFSKEGIKWLPIPVGLLHLQRSASERIRRNSRPNLLFSLWEKPEPSQEERHVNVVNTRFLPTKATPVSSLSGLIGDTVFTGNEAIRDIFKLLGGRANLPKFDHLEVFHWISRWALTSDSLLYYTLGHVLVDTVDSTVDSQPLVGPESNDSWGVTNVAGYGIACQDTRLIHFERKQRIPYQSCPDLPCHLDVQNQCEFLIRQLKRFNPLQNQPIMDTPKTGFPATSREQEPVFVERWQEHGNNVIFLLSTGGWQVNFHNHSKLIVNYPHMLLACDARRQSKEPCYASSVEFFTEDLETEFDRWLNRHPQLDQILQILLFMLL